MSDNDKRNTPTTTTKQNIAEAPSPHGQDGHSRFKHELMKRMVYGTPAQKSDGPARLIFALDATGSRQPTWDKACQLQAEMFRSVPEGLEVQLVYYRSLDECRASPWVSGGDRLAKLMSRIDCRGGATQIGRVLTHACRESEKAQVQALVFIGDAMEEKLDELAVTAGELGLRKVPVFMFQEGPDQVDPQVEYAFREIARLTKGAYCRFDAGSAQQLAELLGAVAAYAAGGVKALETKPGTAKLLEQLRR